MKLRAIGFVAGLLAFAFVLGVPTPGGFTSSAQQLLGAGGGQLSAGQLAGSMQAVSAVLVLMVIWWLTEAVPLSATALLPAVLFPLLKVVGLQGAAAVEFSFKNTLLSYANPVIALFLGGFLLAGAMQKWGLDRRFTLWFLTRGNLANRTGSVLFGMMAVTAFISMWISNTAAAAMMLPLGLGILSILGAQPGKSRYGTALMLGIAWAASIGGMGTLIGTPPNGIAVGILNQTFGSNPGFQRVTFLGWMKVGVPFVAVFLPVAWFILMRIFPPELQALPGGKAKLQEERGKLGPFSTAEKRTIAVFALAVGLWVTNPFWPSLLGPGLLGRVAWLDESLIGLGCGLLLFLIPVKLREAEFLMEWGDTRCVDWGTLVLFGGGLALSDGMFKTGLASWIAGTFVGMFGSPSPFVMLALVVLLVDFLTEVTSNTAVSSMMVPVMISIALKTGADPVMLAVATSMAASLAFMMPVATPPNALVYGTGYVRMREMVKGGLVLDLVGWAVVVGVVWVVWMGRR